MSHAPDRPAELAFMMLPVARPAHYDYGKPPKRESYLVVGVAIADPVSGSPNALHNATSLFCIRPDGRGCWLRLDQLWFDELEPNP